MVSNVDKQNIKNLARSILLMDGNSYTFAEINFLKRWIKYCNAELVRKTCDWLVEEKKFGKTIIKYQNNRNTKVYIKPCKMDIENNKNLKDFLQEMNIDLVEYEDALDLPRKKSRLRKTKSKTKRSKKGIIVKQEKNNEEAKYFKLLNMCAIM